MCLCRGWLSLNYFRETLSPSSAIAVPSAPAECLWLAELKYDRWEAKHNIRINPRRRRGGDKSGGRGSRKDEEGEEEDGNDHVLVQKEEKEGVTTTSSERVVEEEESRQRRVREEQRVVRIDAWRDRIIEHICRQTVSGDTWRRWEKHTQSDCIDLMAKFEALRALRSRVFSTQNETDVCVKAVSLSSNGYISPLDHVRRQYETVLRLLRDIDTSGRWPLSSAGRQRVIETESLVEAGGRGGSFSIGSLPPALAQPRANALFPGRIQRSMDLYHMGVLTGSPWYC